MNNMIVLAYGLFMFVGAFFGWKVGSKISLIAGSVSGILVLLGLYWTTVSPKHGYLFLLIVAGLLTCTFVMRFIKTQHFMPSGMLLLVTALFLIFSITRYLSYKS